MRALEGVPMKILLWLSAAVLCSPAFDQDAMFRGAPQHTGVYAGPGVPQFTKVKWQFHTDGQILSSPAIANGALYVGSSDHFLYALDLAAGTLKWKFKTGEDAENHNQQCIQSSAAVADRQ